MAHAALQVGSKGESLGIKTWGAGGGVQDDAQRRRYSNLGAKLSRRGPGLAVLPRCASNVSSETEKFHVLGARPKLSISLAGVCSISKRKDTHQRHLIVYTGTAAWAWQQLARRSSRRGAMPYWKCGLLPLVRPEPR